MSYNGTKAKYRYFAKNIEISITYELLGRFPSSFDRINCNDRMYAYTYRNRYISRYILHLDFGPQIKPKLYVVQSYIVHST